MAVTIDCGEWNDIHPLDKKTVGERLALCARRLVYGQDVVCDGPVPTGATCRHGTLEISFAFGAGLWAQGGFPIVDVVDETGHVHRFYAAPLGEKLIAQIGDILPHTVRFAWADSPAVPLYNAHHLPASPFAIPITL
jgi:sialate O-acetylesterase